MNFTDSMNPHLTTKDLNKCITCQCNKICDHNEFGYETCNNYIPGWISTRIALPENDRYVLLMRADITTTVEVAYFNQNMNLDFWTKMDGYWMPIPDFKLIG